MCLVSRPPSQAAVQDILNTVQHLEHAKDGAALGESDIYIFLPFILKDIGHGTLVTFCRE